MSCKLDGILAPSPPVLPSASPGRFTEGKEAVTELQDPAGISQMQPRRTPRQQQGPGQFPQPASGATPTHIAWGSPVLTRLSIPSSPSPLISPVKSHS